MLDQIKYYLTKRTRYIITTLFHSDVHVRYIIGMWDKTRQCEQR
jgi:hypothetical protein